MTIAITLVSVLTAAISLWSAVAKLRRDPHVVHVVHEVVGVPLRAFPALAALEIAGAIGLSLGLALRGLGIAASAGLMLYFALAVLAHMQVGDPAGAMTPSVPLLCSAATLTLLVMNG